MKRFWLVMLSLGLVLAFSASAMAVDVKFSGSFYAAGMYQDKTKVTQYAANTVASQSDNISTAFYYQRLRVQTDFIVSPGLKLVTRFDAMERAWGAPRATANNSGTGTGAAVVSNGFDIGSVGTTAENENIAFDYAYVSYTSPIGMFDVGYQSDGTWGTVFGDSSSAVGKIQYAMMAGPVVIAANITKYKELSYTQKTAAGNATRRASVLDQDSDKYTLTATYLINKDSRVGLLYQYQRLAEDRATAGTFQAPGIATVHVINPYAKVKIGPVNVEAEVTYANGELKWEDGLLGGNGSFATAFPFGGTGNVKIDNLSAYLNAVGDFGMFYAGGTIAYVSGDDPKTFDKIEGGFVDGGKDYMPTLLMFNADRNYWVGPINGYVYNGLGSMANMGGAMGNAIFGQVKAGVRPIAALDINASISYAVADKKPAARTGLLTYGPDFGSGVYGWELDVTGTYKITNNLSYMLGGGYWFVGDYFKGTNNDTILTNNFILINKLTLTF